MARRLGPPSLGPPDLRGSNKLVPFLFSVVYLSRGTSSKKGKRALLGDLLALAFDLGLIQRSFT